MDVISIITLAASATSAIYAVSQNLYTFINSVKTVDAAVQLLALEVNGLRRVLRRVLDAIGICFANPLIKSERATAAENSAIWAAVAGALNDCRETVESLAAKMVGLEGRAGGRGRLWRQTARVLKMNAWSADIQTLRFQITTHANNLQIALQMVNILVAGLTPEHVVGSIGRKIESLASSLAELKATESYADGNEARTALLPPHARQLRQSAVAVISNVNELISTGHLSAGSQQEYATSTASFKKVMSDFNRSLYDPRLDDDMPTESPSAISEEDSSSDDDMESELAEALFAKADERFKQQKYPEAEKYFRDGLQHAQNVSRTDRIPDLSRISFKLAICCMHQEKWQEAELMLVLLAKEGNIAGHKISPLVLEAHHALSQCFCCQHEFESALAHCQQAITGRRRMYGKQHPTYLSSLQLLALLYEANGDPISASAYSKKLPASLPPSPENSLVTTRFAGYSASEPLLMTLKENLTAMTQLATADFLRRARPEYIPHMFRLHADALNTGKALYWASNHGHELAARWLLARGAHVESPQGAQPCLNLAATKGHTDVVRTLLAAGADVDGSDNSDRTALLWASLWGHEATVRVLLDHGADVEKGAKDGDTPLMDAAAKGHESVVRMLIEAGADMGARSESGNTPLLVSARGSQLEVARVLVEKGADVEARNREGKTALIMASENRNEALMRLLLAKGADVNARDKGQGSSLLYLVPGGKEGALRLLLEKGADVNAKNVDGETAVARAVDWNALALLRTLLEHGGDVTVRRHEKNMLAYAKMRGHGECVSMLKEFGAEEEDLEE